MIIKTERDSTINILIGIIVVKVLRGVDRKITTKINRGVYLKIFLGDFLTMDTTYINMIIIPPKNASTKIRGNQGLDVSIHLINIMVLVITRIAGIILISEILEAIIILEVVKIDIKNTQNIVYTKILILGIKE